jgi:hypothetical protein
MHNRRPPARAFPDFAARSCMSSVQSASLNFTVRMVTPFSSSAFQGEKFASWSSSVSTISSPGPSSRPMSAAHGESQRCHVRAENDFIRFAIQKVGHCRPRFRDHAVGVAAGLVSAAGVGVVARQVVRDGVNDALRHLRATRAIQKNRGMPMDGLRERGNCARTQVRSSAVDARRLFSDGHGRHSNSGSVPRRGMTSSLTVV